VVRSGGLEDRLTRIEERVAEIPDQWRSEMATLRDRRIAFRWLGLPILLLGIVLTAFGNLA
jgi:hypothetical protein